ncbi:hypothetical protein [Lactobacillus melliventris]|uniref:hypothetical protein n=1 Tax=Lactobacillus melliventris TaxID=1218507 RepID=UPI00164EE0FD|nr:hypothetical protein [Lactobacillus melliventris]MBC6350448.1 hypothetical protein [Lactobacillus melliventris]
MVENPNNPILNLDVQKMQSWVAPAKLMYQGDKGYRQPFRLTNAWNEYEVKAENLCFSATKPDGQIIEVENEPERFTEQDNIWYFLLPDEVTQKTGSVSCYFYVKDNINNIVASTTKFSYQVEAKFTDEERSVSYVSALERLQKKFEEYIENAKVSINQMTDSSNEVKQEAIDRLNEARQQFESQLNHMINQFAEYQSKYNELLSALNQKFDDELVSYQSDYDKWKDSAVKDFEQRIETVTDELTAAEQNQADLKSAIDSAMEAVKKIKDVDFTKYALKEDLEKFYDKTTIDEKLKNAGTLKQISVNGGTPINPDDNGVANIDIDIPKTDLSALETKKDAEDSHNALQDNINKRPLTVNNISPDDKGNISLPLPKQLVQTVENQKPDANGNIQIFSRKLTPYKFLTGNNNNFVFDTTNQTFYVISEINDTYYLFKLDFDFKQIKYVTLTSGMYYGFSIINNMIYICGTAGIFAYDENLQKQYSYSINGVYFHKFFSSNKCLYVTAGDNNVYKMTFALTYLDKKDFTDGYSSKIVLDPNIGKIYGIAQYHENKLYILNESLQVEKTVSLDIPTSDITIINNSIYILTNNSLNKLNSNLSVEKQVSFDTTMLDASHITNDDNSIYFLENQYIHEFDFDLNEKSKTSFFSDSFSIQNINNDYICAMYNQSITNRPLVMLKKNASLIDAIEGIYNYLF